MNKEISAIIMAAGNGSRMEEISKQRPKTMIEIGGVSILKRTIETLRGVGIDDIIVVLKTGDIFTPLNLRARYRAAIQNTASRPGTAEAARQGLKIVPHTPERRVLILNGDDSSLISIGTFKLLIAKHHQSDVDCTVMVIPRKDNNPSPRYLGENDRTPEKGEIFMYSGVLIARRRWLGFFIPQIKSEKDSRESKITCIFALGRGRSQINQQILASTDEWNDFNTPEDSNITLRKFAGFLYP